MRILVATDQWAPDVVGGSARVAADTAHALTRRGHELVVIAPALARLPQVEDHEGFEVHRVLRRGPFPQTLADPVSSFRRARALRGRGFDVMLAHQASTATGLGASGVDAPLGLVFHASVVLEMRFLRRRTTATHRAALYALDPIFVALERTAVRRAAGVLVLSRFSRDLAQRRHPAAANRIRVVGGGVADSFFHPAVDATDCRRRLGIPPGVLLFTARRLETRMGVDILVEALSRIRDPGVVLAVAGRGSQSADLDRMVRRLGLQERVRMLGRVSEQELRNLYAAADLFVLPTVAYEGFGMSTVEALAAGTPAVGTAVGATPEIVGLLGDEFVVPNADPDAIAQTILRILPLLGPELRERARRVAQEHFRWDEAIVRWESALLDLLR